MLHVRILRRRDLRRVAAGGVEQDRRRTSAYGLTNRGLPPRFIPAMSCHTSTCASQSGPAPMPIVGIDQLGR